MITRRQLLGLALPAAALGTSPRSLRALVGQEAQEPAKIYVWEHGSTQGCCAPWTAKLVERGFVVQAERTRDPEKVRKELDIPKDLWCCHTAVMEGYIIEGHVTLDDIDRLLRDRPFISGLAAPSYMDEHGLVRTKGTYDVIAFDRHGMRSIYSTHKLPG